MSSRIWLLALATSALLASASGGCADSDTDKANIESYRLTLPVLNKLVQVNENICATIRVNPSLAEQYEPLVSDGSPDESVGDMINRFEGVPAMQATIAKSGLSTWEWVVAARALVEAIFAPGFFTKRTADEVAKLSPTVRANIAFVDAYEDEVVRWGEGVNQIEHELKRLTAVLPVPSQIDPACTTPGR